MLSEVKQVGRDETERFRAMLSDVETKSTSALVDYQKTAEKLHTASTGATADLVARLGEVARLASGVQELLRVEQAVQQGLQSVNAGQELQKTLAELRRQLEVTTALCQQLGKPRQFTLQENSSKE
jgi:Zn-dependent oligopeptidase